MTDKKSKIYSVLHGSIIALILVASFFVFYRNCTDNPTKLLKETLEKKQILELEVQKTRMEITKLKVTNSGLENKTKIQAVKIITLLKTPPKVKIKWKEGETKIIEKIKYVTVKNCEGKIAAHDRALKVEMKSLFTERFNTEKSIKENFRLTIIEYEGIIGIKDEQNNILQEALIKATRRRIRCVVGPQAGISTTGNLYAGVGITIGFDLF